MKPRVLSQHSPAAGPAAKFLHCLMLLGALAASSSSARAATDGFKVSHPWLRMIIPSRPAAGYFTLSNATDQTQVLIGAASPACAKLMLHQSLNENGLERMVMLNSLPVPAHGAVTFAPGSYHLMCMSPSKEVVKGHAIPITLRFANGTVLTANFPVRGATGK